MIRLLLLFSLFIASLFANAQDAQPCSFTVIGIVMDRSTNTPLPFATVLVEDTKIGVVTNEKGEFKLTDICKPEIDLIISFLGYKTIHHHHDVYHPEPIVYLAPDQMMLSSIVVEDEAHHVALSSIKPISLNKEMFSINGNATFGEIVSQFAGVNTISTGQNIVKPVIHGLHSNRILIINNGIRHEFQNWGADHAPEIDPGAGDQIQLVKGAATVRYGPEALGGVLLIDHDLLSLHTDLSGRLRTGYASNGKAGSTELTLGKGYERLAWKVTGSGIIQGDLSSPQYNLTNTARREQGVNGVFRYHQEKYELGAYFSHFNQKLGILRGSVTGNLEDLVNALERKVPQSTGDFSYQLNTPYQLVRHDLLKLNGSFILGEHVLNLQYGYQKNYRQEYDIRRGTNNEVPAIDLELSTHSFDADWDHPALGNINGIIGTQFQLQQNLNIPGTNTIPFVPNFHNYRGGIFLIESIQRNRMTWEAGLRFDVQYTSLAGRASNNETFIEDLYFQNTTATFGFSYNLKPTINWRMNVSSAWRPPNVAELYRFGKHQSTIQYGLWRYTLQPDGIDAGDVLSQAEKRVNTEKGWKLINTYSVTKHDFQLELTQFVNYLQDYIFSRPAGITNTVRGAFPYYIFDQEQALLIGVDFSMFWRLNPWLTTRATANYLWARMLPSKDFFVGLPPLSIQNQFSIYLPINRLKQPTFDLGFKYEFRQNQAPQVISAREIMEAKSNGIELFTSNTQNFDFVAAPDGYLLLNAGLNTGWKNWIFRFTMQNLLNQRYRSYTDQLRYFSDQTGRNFIFGITYHW